jgi:hypothetical protein
MTLRLPGDDRLVHVAAESMTVQPGADRLQIA